MDRFETTKYYERYSPLKGMAYGAIGGIAAGFVMAPFLIASVSVVGLPVDSIFIAYGRTLGAQADSAMIMGIGIHFLTSILIGVIFGTITSIVDRLRITGIGRGIVEGLVTGMIAFAVLFIPVGVFVLPSFLIQSLAIETELGMEEQRQALGTLEQLMPVLIGLSIGDHLIYGAVLGTVVSALTVRVRKRTKENARIDDDRSVERGEHFESEQRHICPECKRQFVTVQELDKHRRIVHHYSGAA